MLQSAGSQRVGRDGETALTELICQGRVAAVASDAVESLGQGVGQGFGDGREGISTLGRFHCRIAVWFLQFGI